MALPVNVGATSGQLIGVGTGSGVYGGPFIDGNGNVYAVICDDTSTTIEVHKATDPTSSFAEQNAAGAPVLASLRAFTSYAAEGGNTIHIIAASEVNTTSSLRYYTFHMSSHGTTPDTWVLNESVDTFTAVNTANEQFHLTTPGVRADGVVVVAYGCDRTGTMSGDTQILQWAWRSSGGAWTSGGSVETTPSMRDIGGGVCDENGLYGFIYHPTASTTLYYRSISAASTPVLNAVQTVTGAVADGIAQKAAYYKTGSTQRFTFGYFDSGAADESMATVRVDNDGAAFDVTTGATDEDTAGAQGDPTIPPPQASVVSVGTTTYLPYVRGTTASAGASDTYYGTRTDGGSWGTGTLIRAGTFTGGSSFMCANAYVRGGNNRIALLYDDAGQVKYDEVDLGVASSPLPPRSLNVNQAVTRASYW